ncbi:MAG: phosphoribosyl-ATP diphosphatase [Deltaproteobacteria bacterium]|nr:phosphoribosyl-ATP diphosphatase [Deltaproteobacteria bacterium]
MIIPSIDISKGQAVQLVGGREKVLEAGDPVSIARTFGLIGEIAVVDLDAAMGRGSNENIIKELIRLAPCRVGGGIRDVKTAIQWLDAGAKKVMIGTAANPEFLRELPRDRVVVALDAQNDEVVVNGWTQFTGRSIKDRLLELAEFVDNFLITFVELEGRMQGTSIKRVEDLVELLRDFEGRRIQLTIAGGVAAAEEVAILDRLGADAQVGMALYTGVLSLADAFCAVLNSDRADGLWPTVITDEYGMALGLAWSSKESLAKALSIRKGVYHSRSRGLWVKGESSGAEQELLRIKIDCDRDCLCFVVRQHGSGFCHRGTRTCWGESHDGVVTLSRRLAQRVLDAPDGSYTRKLIDDQKYLNAKIIEEANELTRARTRGEIIDEASDVLYFTLTALAKAGIEFSEVEDNLARRASRVTRRQEKVREGGLA